MISKLLRAPSLIAWLRRMESSAWDKMLHINTDHRRQHTQVIQGIHLDSHAFETMSHHTIRKAIHLVNPGPEDTIFDIGCSLGRTVCHSARLPVRKVVGIEISKELAESAVLNGRTCKGRQAQIDIINCDASVADYAEGTVFFLFNPFGRRTLELVLERISISRNPENTTRTRIVYVNPKYIEVFDTFNWLRRIHDITSFAGCRIVVFESYSNG